MINLTDFSINLKPATTIAGAAIAAFVGPVLPYGWICTAMVGADFISARMLARRVGRRLAKNASHEQIKFSSKKFGATIISLAKIYSLLLLSHGIDCTIIGEGASISILRFSAALVCFWQFWSILENEASANNASWARIAQKILIDKTQRHLDIDLSSLKPHNSDKSL